MCFSLTAFAQTEDMCDNGKKAVQVSANSQYDVKRIITTKDNESTTKNSGQNNYNAEVSAKAAIGDKIAKVVGGEGSVSGNVGYNYKGETRSTTNNKETTTVIEKYYKCEDDKQQSKSER